MGVTKCAVLALAMICCQSVRERRDQETVTLRVYDLSWTGSADDDIFSSITIFKPVTKEKIHTELMKFDAYAQRFNSKQLKLTYWHRDGSVQNIPRFTDEPIMVEPNG